RPDAVIHFAEQRAAPYSMKSYRHKNYTVNNNVSSTHNLLNALTELNLDTHLIHLGIRAMFGKPVLQEFVILGEIDQIEV
ncbi:NAD-dependent epimerase/dehydratase family protein, partial [Rhizobium ruizarguesonis]